MEMMQQPDSTDTALKPGTQLASTTCTTRVIVVRAPAEGRPEIACGGAPMVAAGAATPSPPVADAATLIGKRYVDEDETIELLCTASGTGALSVDGKPLAQKVAKALPASD